MVRSNTHQTDTTVDGMDTKVAALALLLVVFEEGDSLAMVTWIRQIKMETKGTLRACYVQSLCVGAPAHLSIVFGTYPAIQYSLPVLFLNLLLIVLVDDDALFHPLFS